MKWESHVKLKMNGLFFRTLEQEKHKKKDGLQMKFKSFMNKIRKEMKQALAKIKNAKNSSQTSSQV